MPKDPAQQKLEDEELDRKIHELALQTRNWARRMGAYRQPDTGHHGYFKISEWKEYFNESDRLFKKVKIRMVKIGEPIARDDFHGHFLGNEGEQMSNVATMLKNICTLTETVGLLMEAVQNSGQWDKCIDDLEERLDGNRHQLQVTDMPKLFASLGMQMPEDIQRRLLPKLLSADDDTNPVGDFH